MSTENLEKDLGNLLPMMNGMMQSLLSKVREPNFLWVVIHVLRDKTMDNELMHTPNCAKQNYLFCRSKLLVAKF